MVNAITPRRACPTLAVPMPTGDGCLARLPPLLAPLTPDQLAGLAGAATTYGNGLVEITKRGNWQIRGLAEDGGPALAAALADLGLDLPDGPPISADPLLPPESVALAHGFAETLRSRLAESGLAARLAPKVALVLDFGTPLAPQRLSGDIRISFRAARAELAIGGDENSARQLGSVPADAAAEAAFALLEQLAGYGSFARLSGAAGIHDDLAFAAILGDHPEFAEPPATTATRDGNKTASDITIIAFPFGQAEAGPLAELAATARAAGILAIAAAPERRLLFAGPAAARAAIRGMAERLGFITDAGDPRQSVFACAGSAGCASGALPTRILAAELAAAVPNLLDGSFQLHVSGCAKGCAHPEAAAISLAALDNALAIVLEGRPRDPARGIVPAKEIAGRLARLAAAVAQARIADEPSALVLRRLGAAAIEDILLGTVADGTRKDGSGIDGRERDRREPRLSA